MAKIETFKNLSGCKFIQNIAQVSYDLRFIHCGIQVCSSEYTYNHKIPKEYHLHFVYDGKGEITVGGTSYSVKHNQIFLIPKGTKFRYSADKKSPWKYFWVTIDGESCEEFLEYIQLSPQGPVINSVVPIGIYMPYIEKILATNKAKVFHNIERQGLLLLMLSELIKNQNSALANNTLTTSDYIDCAIKYITNNFATVTVSEVAKYIGLNRSHFSTLFKSKLNISPQQFILEYKLDKAKIYLKDSTLSLGDIASRVGYDTQDAFSKSFKSHFNVTPSNFRSEQQVES